MGQGLSYHTRGESATGESGEKAPLFCKFCLTGLKMCAIVRIPPKGVYFFVPFFGHEDPPFVREAEQISDYREVPL